MKDKIQNMYLIDNKTPTLIARHLKVEKTIVDDIISDLGIRKKRSYHNVENGKMRYKEIHASTELIKEIYERTKSSYRVAEELKITPYKAKETLKKLGLIRSMSKAASERNRGYVAKICSELKMEMIDINRTNLYDSSKYRSLKKLVIKNRGSKCENCYNIEGLEIHHIIPLFVTKDSFFDVDNMKVFCKQCHFKIGHNGNWISYNPKLITEKLRLKYNIDRERLNEKTSKNEDAKV